MRRLNVQFLQQFWSIAKLYWFGNEKWGAIAMLSTLIILVIVSTHIDVLANAQQGNVLSALATQDSSRFWTTTRNLFGLYLIMVAIWSSYNFIRKKLTLYWRRWLTHHFLEKYFGNRAFYELSQSHQELDNPDQRISEDTYKFADGFLSFFFDMFHSSIKVIAFSAVLWGISKTLMIVLIVYASTGTIFSIGFFGRKLVKLHFAQRKKEGNFRFGLVRLRENAESIAFYRGEAQEAHQLNLLFNQVFNNFNKLLLWQEFNLNAFIKFYEFIPSILPAIIVAPQILSGQIEVGKFGEAQGAFMSLFRSMFVIANTFHELVMFAASTERLSELYTFLQQPLSQSKYQPISHTTIKTVEDKHLALQNLTLYTPNYQRILCQDISVKLQPGQGLLIMGTSGCGKSSLLRAIAGLWNSGNGRITRPKLEEILFLPQRPYMLLGTLRNQLVYPQTHVNLTDSELHQVLQQINLSDLAQRFGGFDVEKDWHDVLSLGEQQRVAFARILIAKPKYVILDEATSALDVKNEENLYRHLLETKTTFISVGHRPSLLKYHQTILEILDSKQWKVQQV